jgi:hypothetical protein
MAVRYAVFDSPCIKLTLCRFFERISPTYNLEKWGLVSRTLLKTWYACSQQLGNVNMSVRLLLQLITKASGAYLERLILVEFAKSGLWSASVESEEGDTQVEDLYAILKVKTLCCMMIG